MREPMESYMRVGIIHPMAFPEVMKGDGPIIETVKKIAEDEFFGAIEVTRINDVAVRQEVKKMLQTAKMDVIFAAQPALLMGKLNLNSEKEAERQAAIDNVKESIDQAYEVGASILAVLSGPDPGEDKRERAKELLVDSMKQLCRYAQEKGQEYILAVSLENFDRLVDKKCLIGPSTEAAAIAEAVRQEYTNFGLTVDLSHLPLLKEKPHDALIPAFDALIHVHIGNCVLDESSPVYGDQHPRFGIEGGETDVEQLKIFLETLIYVGYFKKSVPTSMPVISFEVKPLPGESSELVIANAKRTLKEAWAKL